jgi:hypothetical protein
MFYTFSRPGSYKTIAEFLLAEENRKKIARNIKNYSIAPPYSICLVILYRTARNV